MTSYIQKTIINWKRYKLNTGACAENDTCLLFYLYLWPRLSKSY